MEQKIITVFQDFKATGDAELQVPNGYIVKQIVTSAIENANHLSSGTIKQPRLAITMLIEKK